MTLMYWINKSEIGIGWVWHISEGDYTHDMGWTFTLWGSKRQLNRRVKNRWKRQMIKTGSTEYWYEYGVLK